MKKTGAWLMRYALEQIGVKYTFGIPGVHNTELYDELNRSDSITPILVTHEGGGAFMADAISRTSDQIGCLVVVPAAGLTHAMSGIAEAFLDGVPMMVISGGIRTDGMKYQLHDMDQHLMMSAITKKTYKITEYHQIVPTVYEAYELAISGEPGPVYIELPVNIGLFKGEIDGTTPYHPTKTIAPVLANSQIDAAAELLLAANHPGIFAGWGAVESTEQLIRIAELLNAPVSTTLQGLSAFPASHPLHTGMGFGIAAVPAAYNAFKHCDCLLAIGTRFAEIPTGSFGIEVPENLIHIDINPKVFNANYPAKVSVEGDAKAVLTALLKALEGRTPIVKNAKLTNSIKQWKKEYRSEWMRHDSKNRVNPAKFFAELNYQLDESAYIIADDGNHTFLTAELMSIHQPRHYVSPTDFNCMGYATPAAIGTKLVHPDNQVVGIVGDGAFLMTCMELLTASNLNIAPMIFVFNDGELSQISQAQAIPYNRKTCTQLKGLNFKGVALATGCEYLSMQTDADIEESVRRAIHLSAQKRPVIIDVNIDYSKKTRFTKGVVGTNLKRFEAKEKVRFIGRAIVRKVTG